MSKALGFFVFRLGVKRIVDVQIDEMFFFLDQVLYVDKLLMVQHRRFHVHHLPELLLRQLRMLLHLLFLGHTLSENPVRGTLRARFGPLLDWPGHF